MSTIISYDEAIAELAKLTKSGRYTVSDLVTLGGRVSVETATGKSQGSVTLLYSGQVNGVSSSALVGDMVRQGADIRVIDKTQAGAFLMSREFNAAFESLTDAMSPLEAKAAGNLLYDARLGPWAEASRRFAADTIGEVRFLGPNADITRQFGAAELPNLLAPNSKVTRIEGIAISELRAMDITQAFDAIKARSSLSAGLSGLIVSAQDVTTSIGETKRQLSSLNIGDFLESDILDASRYIEGHPEAPQNLSDFWKTGLTEIESTRLKTWIRGAGNKLGVTGSFLVFSIAFSEAANAAESGNTEKARQIMETWAIEAAGGTAGAAIGSAVVALAVGAAALMGAAVSVPVAAVLAIGAGIIGGIYGPQAATDAWAALRGSADNDELNFLEKLAARVTLTDFALVFGSRNADNLSGSTQADYLFGGGANDVLQGNDGNDVLRGGAGEDDLQGNAGNDQLDGGDDSDTLDGGAGSDTLSGGAGTDKYMFTGDFGNDVIIDSDASGQIMVDGQTLSAQNAKKISANTYKDKTTGWTFFKGDVQTDGTATLVISKEGARNSSITVRNWKSGQMGITLSDTQEEAPAGLSVFKGDQRPLIYGVELIESGAADNTYAWSKVTRDPATGTLQGQAKAEADFADVFYGTGGADDIQGLGGNDALSGGPGNDKIDGGTGNDLIGGGSGSDTIQGGAGNDQILGGLSVNVPQRKSPSDKWTVPSDAKSVIISGPTWGVYDSNSKDAYVITGAGSTQDDQPDYIDGGAGDDRILASRGNDYVNGGDDKDVIKGLAGADLLYGGAGNDSIEGDGPIKPGYLETTAAELHGNDLLDGGAGNDTLVGQGGKDMLFGGDNDDSLWGDSTEDNFPIDEHDDDTLDGGAGNDQIIGGGKNDLAYGGAGNDKLWGDDVDDRLAVSAHGNDTLDGGIGDDQLIGGGSDDLLIGDMGMDILWGDDSSDNVPEFAHGKDTLQGGQGDDELVGGGDADELFGGDDNDKLWGDDTGTYKLDFSSHGADYLDGGKGNDQLIGGGKGDTLIGGEGDDSLLGDESGQNLDVVAHGKDHLSGGLGKDRLIGGGEADELHGGADNDIIYGDDVESKVSASAHGNDALHGDDGLDTLIGGGKDDTLFGGSGNDALWGDDTSKNLGVAAHGKDQLYGGDGVDQLIGGGSEDQLFGGIGADTLSGDDVVANVAGSAHGADFLDGGVDNDTLFGDGGNDTLMGGSGNDFLAGEHQTSSSPASQASTLQGDDLLMGEDGTDVLLGGEGQDTLDGGSDNDTMVGGSGSDEYRFGKGSGVDTVYLESADGAGDTILLQDGLTAADIDLSRTETSLILKIKNTSDQITLNSFFSRNTDVIRFDNGDVLKNTSSLASSFFHSTDQSDYLKGYAQSEYMFGGLGGDTIYGNAGNDTLEGGAGYDKLYGGSGNDTYVFGRNDNADEITDSDSSVGNVDTISFKSGIRPDDVLVHRRGQDLILSIKSTTNDSTTVRSHFYPGNSNAIERIVFVDAPTVTWDLKKIRDLASIPTDSAEQIWGDASNDSLAGEGGNDSLYGEAGDDTLNGGSGDDIMDGGLGDDVYIVSSGFDAIASTEDARPGKNNTLRAIDTISTDARLLRSGDFLEIYLNGNSQRVRVQDFLRFDNPYNTVNPLQTIQFKDTTWSLSQILSKLLEGSPDSDYTRGTTVSERIEGLDGDDSILGLSGDDTLDGGRGDDSLEGGAGADWLYTGSGTNDLQGGADNDTYIIQKSGTATIKEQSGDDIIVIDNGKKIAELRFFRAHRPTNDSTELGLNLIIADNLGNRIATITDFFLPENAGISSIENIRSSIESDIYSLNTLAQSATQLTGKADTMTGTSQGDVYLIDHPQDVINESADGSGVDVVQTKNDYALPANIENMIGMGALGLKLFGNSAQNRITGSAGNDTLAGNAYQAQPRPAQYGDSLEGGQGDDTYIEIFGSDQDFLPTIETNKGLLFSIANYNFTRSNFIEKENEGIDTLITNAPGAVLADNIENLRIKDSLYYTGFYRNPYAYRDLPNFIYSRYDSSHSTDYYVHYKGNSLNNVIDATGYHSKLYYYGMILDGGTGADTMIGGYVDTVFVVDNPQDKIIDGSNTLPQNLDNELWAFVSYALPNHIKTGIALADGILITGNDSENTLIAHSKNATLSGGKGDDTYYVSLDKKTTIVESENGGRDKLVLVDAPIGSTHNLADYKNIEVFEILDSGYWSNSGKIIINGTDLADEVYGGGGEIYGNKGNDVLSDKGRSIPQKVSWPRYRVFKDLIDGGDGDDTLTASDMGDTLIGGAGNDELRFISSLYEASDNQVPAILDGGAGSDTYAINSFYLFSIIESTAPSDDRDKIVSYRETMTLSQGVEDLVFAEGRARGTGNSLGNMMAGNKYDDVLSGLGGNDTLYGYEDNDTLEGGLGQDALYGGAGADTYIYNTGDGYDVIYGQRAEDTLRMKGFKSTDVTFNRQFSDINIGYAPSGTSYNILTLVRQAFDSPHEFTGVSQIVFDDKTITADDIRKLALQGTSGNDTNLRGYATNDTINGFDGNDSLYGEGGNDLLDGGDGADTMAGGAGNDVYWVNSPLDEVIEDVGGGHDTIKSAASILAPLNIESIELTGVADASITGHLQGMQLLGNAGRNAITGGSASDLLFGGYGLDTLSGANGNDIYVLLDEGDQIIEAAASGQDAIWTMARHTQMAANTEVLYMAGAMARSAVGSSGDDVIHGSDQANEFWAALGNDTLMGGVGSDLYHFARGDGSDLIIETAPDLGSQDQISFDGSITPDQLWLTKTGQDLQITLVGTRDQVIVQNWFANEHTPIESIHAFGHALKQDKVGGLVEAMARFNPPPLGQTTMPSNQLQALAPALAAAWSN